MDGDAPTKKRLVKLVVRGDGQSLLATMQPGDPLALVRDEGADPETPVVIVATAGGAPIGVLGSADSALLAPNLGGMLQEVTLHHLTGGTAAHPGQEAQIGLRWLGQDLRAPIRLTAAQLAWRNGEEEVPESVRPRRREVDAGDGVIARIRRFAAAYAAGQLTWKMTFLGIAVSTVTMTIILIVFGDR